MLGRTPPRDAVSRAVRRQGAVAFAQLGAAVPASGGGAWPGRHTVMLDDEGEYD
jgi:hypothetical protein